MSNDEAIKAAIDGLFKVSGEPDGTSVVTQCIYPSNEFVRVLVRGGTNTFVVSDEGGAIHEIEAAGAEAGNIDKQARKIVDVYGLKISNGVIRSDYCRLEDLALCIALVGNASKQVADWLFATKRIKPSRDFKMALSVFLRAKFNDHVHEDSITGASNKPHKFDNIIAFPSGRRLIIDAVTRDSNSINSRVIANMDIKQFGYSNLEQRIIYDDSEEWKAEDLNLLQVGAPTVGFSKAHQVIDRIANAS